MSEKQRCKHDSADLCVCKPIEERDHDPIALLLHVSTNMEKAEWELDYTDINRPEKRRLCLVGVCRVCGGRLCHELDASDDLAGDDFLAAIYRHLYQFHNANGRYMSSREFREKFTLMFHEQDRTFIREWLARPENRNIHSMYRRSAKPETITIYTIIRTGADADHGSFLDPTPEGSYLSLERAKLALEKLITAEKEELDNRYDCEERGENYWEAYQDGYAAALFSRLEILRSPLMPSSDGDVPEKVSEATLLEETGRQQRPLDYDT